MPHRRNALAAFTLVELLVVIVIIGVLIAILVPALSAVKKYAQNASTSALMTAISSSCEAYFQTFSAYPGPIPAMPLPAGISSTTGGSNKISGTQGMLIGLTYPCYIDTSQAPSGNSATYYKISAPNAPTVSTVNQKSTTVAPPTPASYSAKWVLIPDSEASTAANYPTPAEVNPMDSIGPMNSGANPPALYPPFFKPSAKEISGPNPSAPTTWFAGGVTGINGSANTFPFPTVLDRYTDAMPILYYRRTVGVDGTASTDATGLLTNTVATSSPGAIVASGARSNASPTNIASYYYDENSEYTNATALAASTGLTFDETQGGNPMGPDALALEILTQGTNAGLTTSTSYNARGGYVLISAGYDHLYGTNKANGKCDDIVIVGGTR